MCDLFIEKFSEKVVELAGNCNCSSCGCQERLKFCKHPERTYNHYPFKIATILMRCGPHPSPQTDIDVVLSIIHSSESFERCGDISKLRDYMYRDLIIYVRDHWDCIRDENLGYWSHRPDGIVYVYTSLKAAKDVTQALGLEVQITSFREWVMQKFPEKFTDFPPIGRQGRGRDR